MTVFYICAVIACIICMCWGWFLCRLYQNRSKTFGALEVRHNTLTPDTDEYKLVLDSDAIFTTKNYGLLRIKHIKYTREINSDYNEN